VHLSRFFITINLLLLAIYFPSTKNPRTPKAFTHQHPARPPQCIKPLAAHSPPRRLAVCHQHHAHDKILYHVNVLDFGGAIWKV
ncbi:MAG: hypothetical protein KC443_23710, partial [Anaerolineales bacterium]|nr:hypothetical protein [Anaerolineales bacterium]